MADAEHLPDPDDQPVVYDDLGINDEEREDIHREIETLVSQGGTVGELAAEYLRPRRSGVGLPILVWVVAAAVFAGGFLYLDYYFADRDEAFVSESRAFFTTEAQLIEEILRESAQALALKEQEIDQIQSRLVRLGEERLALEANIETEIEARSAELRAALEAELAAERERLAAAGASDADIDARLATIEAEREAELAAQLGRLRAEAQEAVVELEQQLAAQQQELQGELTASRQEREQLLRQATEREAQLRGELEQELAALEDAERAAVERIRVLQEAQEAETLLADRILGSFTVILQDIQEGRLDDAVAGLDSLDRLLRDVRARTDAAEQRRRTELALAGTLRGLVQEIGVLRESLALRDLTATPEETGQIEQERAAALIRTAADTVALAERARQEARWNDARALYQQALATIPSLNLVYPGILALESSRRGVVLTESVDQAERLLDEGLGGQAAQTYVQGLRLLSSDDDDPILAFSGGIARAIAGVQAELLDAQDEIEQEYQALIVARDQQLSTLNSQLTATRTSLLAAEQTAGALRAEVSTLQTARNDLATRIDSLTADLAAARRATTQRDDQIARLSTELTAARARVTSLEQSLRAAQESATAAQAAAAIRENELRDALRAAEAAARDSAAAAAATAAATATAAVAEPAPRTDTVATIDDAELRALTESLDRTRDELASIRTERDTLTARVDEANAEIGGLERELAALRQTRDAVAGDASALESRIADLTRRIAELDERDRDVQTLQAAYRNALASARDALASGRYDDARTRVAATFASPTGLRLFPELSSVIDEAVDGLVANASTVAATESRQTTIRDVVSLTTQVRRNIDGPRQAPAVQSQLRRFPDLEPVADEVFEIVELSAREISAVEIEYRLLGSIARVTGNLVVVERLVTTPAAVGDAVEVRRTPQLRQEIGIATGTIIEVTDQRVVVRVDAIYQIDQQPQTRDIVYIAVR